MATESYSLGDAGVVKLMQGATTYNLSTDYTTVTLKTAADMLETTKGTTRDRTYKAGNKGWSAVIDCQQDANLTAAGLDLNDLVEGWGGSMILAPTGETTGERKVYGSILIMDVSESLSQDGIATVTLSLQGTGALTRTVY